MNLLVAFLVGQILGYLIGRASNHPFVYTHIEDMSDQSMNKIENPDERSLTE
jgi:hypothetical protein